MTTIRDILLADTTHIAPFEKELLLAHALTRTRVFVLTHPEHPVTKRSKKTYESLLARRNRHEPIALIVGRKEFFGREFIVNRHTLVPRPETELLVEKTLEHIEHSKYAHVAVTASDNLRKKIPTTLIIDIGTGSGNIIVTLAAETSAGRFKKRKFDFVAVDISTRALRIARKNARIHNTNRHIRFIRSDLLTKVPKKLFRNAHEIIVVANLPYLSTKEYGETPLDVRGFEPHSALESGTMGIDHYQRLFCDTHNIIDKEKLSAPMSLFLEIGAKQRPPLKKLLSTVFPNADSFFFRDTAEKWRLARIFLSD